MAATTYRTRIWTTALLRGGMGLALSVVACQAPAGDDAVAVDSQAAEKERLELKGYWKMYLDQDPGWPVVREKWITRGVEARSQLLGNLYLELMKGYKQVLASGDPLGVSPEQEVRYRRARREMVYVREDAILFLVDLIRVHTSKPRIDWLTVDALSEVLADLCPVEELTAILADGSSSPPLRRATMKTLARVDDEAVVPHLLVALQKDSDWQMRAEAVKGLVFLQKNPRAHDAAVSAMLVALRDPDFYVMRCAAEGLVRIRELAVQRALFERYEREYDSGRRADANRLYEILRTNTHQLLLPNDPRSWRDWLASQSEEQP